MLPGLPIHMNWHAMIPEFVWNDHFCDEQTSGPFHYWRHCHSVKTERRDGVNGTVVKDRVEYEMPLGPLGDLVDRITGPALFRYLFGVRHKNTRELMPLFAEKLAARAQSRTQ
jgi:ligand-binding SRPBCC domain-containing protein